VIYHFIGLVGFAPGAGAWMKKLLCLTFVLMVLTMPSARSQIPSTAIYTIDAAHSRLELVVSRAGILKMAGHDHKIAAKSFSGEVRVNSANIENSSVRLSIESASLTVLDPGVPEKERQEVQATMQGTRVLNSNVFPAIAFRSTRVSGDAATAGAYTITGKLYLHGAERDISFPVYLRLENNLLRATGTATIVQSDFGIAPITAALGTVRVKDQVQLKFDCLAERTNP
jgi:polyisoprenoid-binding protein YceI